MSKEMRDFLIMELPAEPNSVFQAGGLLGLGDLAELITKLGELGLLTVEPSA